MRIVLSVMLTALSFSVTNTFAGNNCASGLTCFSNGSITNADDVNANFKALSDKIGNSTPGSNGAAGATGPAGPQGPKGDKGDTGQQGLQGATGSQGPKGDVGTTGPQGPKGDTGSQGPAGSASTVAGPQGPKGDKGDTGPQGSASTVAGPQGPKGDTGSIGPAGPQGLSGPVGPQGPKGDTGPQGPAGSASKPVCTKIVAQGSQVTCGTASAIAYLPSGYTLTGGGCTSSSLTRYLIENNANSSSWSCKSQDRDVCQGGSITATAIGCQF